MVPSSCQLELARPSVRQVRVRPDAGRAGILGLLCLVLFFFQLGDRDLASSHEARAGQDAQTMLNSGEWDLPRLFDGRVEMQKPPLYYWLVALLGWFNGGEVNAWCVRLPAALAALACVLLPFWWGLLRGRPLAGFLAAVMLATALHFTTLARTGRIDMPLTLMVSLTLMAFAQGRQQEYRPRGGGCGWYLVGYLALAAGVMLKGPIALVLPLAVRMARWALQRLQRLESGQVCPHARHWLWGIPLVLLLTLPWYLWANWQTDGEWFRVFFWYHNVERGLGPDEKLRAYPLWFYGPQLMLDFLPWSVLLPFGLAYAWRQRHKDHDARFGAIWLLAMFMLLSVMRFKRADYLLPAFPGAAWMLGCAADAWYRDRPTRRAVVACASVVGATVGLWLGYIALIVPAVDETRSHRRFAEEVRRHTGNRVLLFRAEAHNVAFHVGPPLDSLLEWENLDVWAGKSQTTYVIMPPGCVMEARSELTSGTLEVVARSEDLVPPARQHLLGRVPWLMGRLMDLDISALDNRERPLVLVRTHCLPKT
jgi:4-amino-4-deoxy-L-arabinose transferase-like glycosyltransferase